jgi:hypothetical protein
MFSITSIFRIYIDVAFQHICIYIYMLPFQTKNPSPGDFSLIHLPIAHRANGSLLFVCFVDKETESSYPFASRLYRVTHLCQYQTDHIEHF